MPVLKNLPRCSLEQARPVSERRQASHPMLAKPPPPCQACRGRSSPDSRDLKQWPQRLTDINAARLSGAGPAKVDSGGHSA